MLENLWKMFENLNLGKLSLKLVFLKNFASHTHAFYSFFSLLGGIYAKTGIFFLDCVFFGISIDQGYFFDQLKFFQNFWVSFCLFQSIENRAGCFITSFSDGSNTFSKSFLPFLSPYDSVKANLHFFVIFDLSFC